MLRLHQVVVSLSIIFGITAEVRYWAKRGDSTTENPETKYESVQINNYRPVKNDDYVCVSKKLDPDTTYYLTGFSPLDPLAVAHHLMIYACEEPAEYTDDYWPCGMIQTEEKLLQGRKCGDNTKETLLYLEAMQSTGYQLPDGASFKVGKGSGYNYLVVQIHYNYVAKFEADETLTDSAGIQFAYQTTATPFAGGVTILATVASVLPNSVAPLGFDHVEAVCDPSEFPRDHTIVAFAFRVHTHGLGTHVSAFRVRDHSEEPDSVKRFFWRRQQSTTEKEWTLIGAEDPRKEQLFYPIEEPIIIRPTDTLVHRCTYSNPGDEEIMFGEGINNEMCNYYIMFYVLSDDIEAFDKNGIKQCYPVEQHVNWEDHEDEIGPIPDWVDEVSLYFEK